MTIGSIVLTGHYLLLFLAYLRWNYIDISVFHFHYLLNIYFLH